MRNAIVAIEDARFYSHGAFDLHGTVRALISTLSGSQVQGGSTLAQQYVKNACILTATSTAQVSRLRRPRPWPGRCASCGSPPTSCST